MAIFLTKNHKDIQPIVLRALRQSNARFFGNINLIETDEQRSVSHIPIKVSDLELYQVEKVSWDKRDEPER